MLRLNIDRPAEPWRPAPDENNVWYEDRATDAVSVFVHGFISDSHGCWYNAAAKTYWPALLRDAEPTYSIFLGGYKTGVFSRDYQLFNCVDELWTALNIPIKKSKRVLEHQRIVFITHSLGGIVVRKLLVKHREHLRDKDIGLLPMASPSLGSGWANAGGGVAEAFGNAVGEMLQSNSSLLTDLHNDFRNVVHEAKLTGLHGMECAEDLGILPGAKPIVSLLSAGQYFGEPHRLPNTNHATCVKPDNDAHPASRAAQLFLQNFAVHCQRRDAARQAQQAVRTVAEETKRGPTLPQDFAPMGIFVGRQHELDRLAAHLLPSPGTVGSICSINGLPGIGKSYLCDQFARQHKAEFPGGYVRLSLDPKQTTLSTELSRVLAERLGIQGSPADRHFAIQQRLRFPPTLLHIENVDSVGVAQAVGELLLELPECSIVVSGRVQDLGHSQGWTPVVLDVLSPQDGLNMLEREFRRSNDEFEKQSFIALLNEVGHLPLAIHLVAGQLRYGVELDRIHSVLDLRPKDPAHPHLLDPRFHLRTSIELSVELLLRGSSEEDRTSRRRALFAFGAAPLCGVGEGLGASICDLTGAEFRGLMLDARSLSLVLPVSNRPRDTAFRAHPLVRDFLRSEEQPAAATRRDEWFLGRLSQSAGTASAEAEIRSERDALTAWLSEAPTKVVETAFATGRIGDIYEELGEHREAYRIRHQKEVPFYLGTGDVKRLSMTYEKILASERGHNGR